MEYTIKDCYEIWKEEKQNTLNPLTYIKYNSLAQNYLLPELGNRKVEQLTMEDVECFRRPAAERGLTGSNAGLAVTLLKRFFKIAGTDTVGLGLEQKSREKSPKKEVVILNRMQQKCMENILEEENNEKYLSVAFALKMGLMLGEICALEWKDINFERRTVQIRNTLQRIRNNSEEAKKTVLVRMPLAETTKRELPIPEQLMHHLEEIRKAEGSVLECKKAKLPDPRREQIRLEKLVEDRGMHACNFNVLRDTFSVRCLEAGMMVEDLSYVLGHATVTITAERYKGYAKTGQERIAVVRGIMERV